MSSTFSLDGILLGATEYSAYAAIARRIVVACISSVVLRLFFAHRIGLFLTAELSSKAGFRIFLANLKHPSNATTFARLQVIWLFCLAFFVSRALDVIVSTTLSGSALVQRSQQIAFVQTCDTSSSARSVVHTATIRRPYNRSDVYHALHRIVQPALDQNAGGTRQIDNITALWPKTIGMLSDAEVAALALAGKGSMCSPVPLKSPPNVLPAGFMNASSIPSFSLTRLSTRAMSLFGEDVEFIGMNSSSVGANLRFAIPVPISFIVAQDGQQQVAPQSRRHFGVLSNFGPSLTAYDIECGLTPEDVSDWLTKAQKPRSDRTSLNPDLSSTLWYHDLFRVQLKEGVDEAEHGWAAALFLNIDKEGYNAGELELLSIGSPVRGNRPQFRMSVLPLANMFRNDRAIAFSTPAYVVPQRPANQTKCLNVTVASDLYSPGSDKPAPSNSSSSSSNLDTEQQQIRQCWIDLGPGPTTNRSRVMHYFHDPANRGAQICRTKLLYRASDGPADRDQAAARGDGFFDFIAATRFDPVSAKDTSSRVRCFPHGKPLAPVSLPFASTINGRWGYIVDNAMAKFNQHTDQDPHGAQAWFLNVVLVRWWEIGLVVAALVATLLLGEWDDIAEVVTIVMYSFSYHPKPPFLHQDAYLDTPQQESHPHCPASLHNGAMGINLLQPITYAVVSYDSATGSTPSHCSLGADVRVLPRAWDVQPGDNVSLHVRGGTHSGCGSQVPAARHAPAETVLATGTRVGHLVQVVRRPEKTQV